MKYKVEDRVVDVAVYKNYPNVCYGQRGVVTLVLAYTVIVHFDDKKYGTNAYIPNDDSLISEEVYNSPLWKALNED